MGAELGPRPGAVAAPRLTRAQEQALAAVRAHDHAVTIAELSEATGLHANSLRPHLDALAGHGLLIRERSTPTGRGRPAWLWRPAPAPRSEYAGLAATLARTLKATSPHPTRDAVEAGRAWGRDLARAHPAAGDPRENALELLDELGFAPRPAAGGREDGQVRLTRCPLLAAAKEQPTIVCNVHLGLVAGALEGYDAADPDVSLVPFAEPGACLLRLSAG